MNLYLTVLKIRGNLIIIETTPTVRYDAAVYAAAAVMLAMELRKVFGSRVLGPEKPFVSRVNTWYIQQIMLKVESGASMKKVKALLRQVYDRLAPTPQIKSSQIHYDVDPV